MPKILINEVDRTLPGVPDGYTNYSVLVTGFTDRNPDPSDEIQPDANGIYEFITPKDFLATIGLVKPLMTGKVKADPNNEESEENDITLYHYGNQMAWALLNLGYSIVYKPLYNIEEVADSDTGMCSEVFWEIFKDKSNYDFRFITHGLLESHSNIKPENYEFQKRLNEVNKAIEQLNIIATNADIAQAADKKLEKAAFQATEYEKLDKDSLPGLIDTETEEIYPTYGDAVAGTEKERAYLESLNLMTEPRGTVTTSVINTVNKQIANLAEYNDIDRNTDKLLGRGDCVALLELDEQLYTTVTSNKPENLIMDATHALDIDDNKGRFCAVTVPSVYYATRDDFFAPNLEDKYKFPGSFHYLACFMNSLKQGFAEWYAAAGYTRGVSSYTVDYTPVKLGEIAINALEPRNYEDGKSHPKFACNVIAYFRGSYYLWGNRTAKPLGKKGDRKKGDLVATSFLNIRQLCSTIKKQLYVSCRMFTFDPNSDTLWFNFVNAIKPTLEVMKADQGIRDYRIVKEITDKKATLKAKIRIIPIEAVEDFDLEVSLEDSFGETVATVGEAV